MPVRPAAQLCASVGGAPPVESHHPASRQAVPGGGDLCGGEKRRGECRRAQARFVTCSLRLSERNGAKRNAASSAARPTPEHRSGVFAQRKPPQCEPPPGTACREAAREKQRTRHAPTNVPTNPTNRPNEGFETPPDHTNVVSHSGTAFPRGPETLR
jgi:hypothetical protein